MCPTQVSSQTVQIAKADLEKLISENEKLRKQQPKPLKLAGRVFKSKYHDFESYVKWYAKDAAGNLIKDGKGFYEFDKNAKTFYINTVQNRDFLDGKSESYGIYEEE